jgi:hypothetical protein
MQNLDLGRILEHIFQDGRELIVVKGRAAAYTCSECCGYSYTTYNDTAWEQIPPMPPTPPPAPPPPKEEPKKPDTPPATPGK